MATFNDMTRPADLLSHAKGTGHLRSQIPVYMDFMPPCNSACPAGENIQGWLSHAQAGNYFEAFQALMEDNPFPALMGRVCVKPCETGCNRNHIDSTVNIHAVERFIGDRAIEEHWPVRFSALPTGKKVLIIGAGPAGLSAAYHLTRMGHAVSVYDAGERAGGLIFSGVPDYRLPKEILAAEVARIEQMGVSFHFNHRVNDLAELRQGGGFDAVFLGIGAQVIDAENFTSDGSVLQTDAFRFFNLKDKASFSGKKVVVYGGGKLAMYLARVVKRLGSDVQVLYEGDRKMMPAYDYETDDALAEGVDVQLCKRIIRVANGALEIEIMKIDKNTAKGTGEFEQLPLDALIMANRQQCDSAWLKNIPGLVFKSDGTVETDQTRMTGAPGIFAGGDMLPGENRSSTIAIGHGKKAAKHINAFLQGQPFIKPPKHPTASFKKLHIWYQTEAPQKEQNKLAPQVAVKSFDEIASGLEEADARFEAQRCLSCGNCFECDGCFGSCPENAILKLGPGRRYEYDYDKCTGCAVCYEQCPCHAIEMVPDPAK